MYINKRNKRYSLDLVCVKKNIITGIFEKHKEKVEVRKLEAKIRQQC